MIEKKKDLRREIPAIKVKQWLKDWDKVAWDPEENRSKPEKHFYQFSISASKLRALSGVYSRTTDGRKRGKEDLGIQRRHEPERSEEIAKFVKSGYPWSELSKSKQSSEDYRDLRKPGWLPTAIVINILKENDSRHGNQIDKSDVVHISERDNGSIVLQLPENFTNNNWKYKKIPPIEIIDGQHRLWAFDTSNATDDFELPVVAFSGLDISWQAYLFYIINIKPKKINASLAFDLYPLLRAEDWLNKFEGHIIYRETRAQELVDILYSHQESPWYKCINMLGEPGYKGKMVSQSAWVNSLLASYIKSWEGRGIRAGGLFGAPVGSHKEVLPWSRAEQAAFLIVIGQHIRDEINQCKEPWAQMLRQPARLNLFGKKDDLAFYGPNSLLNQDQGIRGILHVSNDLTYFNSDKLNLISWGGKSDFEGPDEERVKIAITSLNKEKKIIQFIKELAKSLASYDWRASGTPGLTEQESLTKAAFRGSGGYKELRRHLLRYLSKNGSAEIVTASNKVLKALGY